MSHPDSPTQADSKRRIPLASAVLVGLAALIAGVLLGGGATFLAFGGSSDSLEDARSKAETGCAIVDRLAEDYTTESDFGGPGEDPVWNEIIAASALLMAAGDMDSEYEHLRSAGSTVLPGLDQSEQGETALPFDDVVVVCEDI